MDIPPKTPSKTFRKLIRTKSWPSGSSRRSPAQQTCSPPMSTHAAGGSPNRLGYWHTFSTWYSTADAVKSDLFIQSDKNLSAAAERVFKLLGHACDAFSSFDPYDAAAVSQRARLVSIGPPGEKKCRSRSVGPKLCRFPSRIPFVSYKLGNQHCVENKLDV